MKDLAAVNKVEMLPWDEWGRMTEAYALADRAGLRRTARRGRGALLADDVAAIESLYRDRPELTVPPHLIG